ncbi:thiamine-phosphate kinase [Verrucomicrobium spinosum]|uniref:thiamine-phosphate kinase n=1 Tax=Verrucomicrobium spinosum TaxID=2736 RepID=UPI00094629CC|nr:thiamine-phosphate kinase [Verrucomicrobium spinosum]
MNAPDLRLTLASIGEDELISRLVQHLPQGPEVIAGPGDDCAVVRAVEPGWDQLLKTDCVVEGVHFLREAAPEQVGWKALARVVSDVASMGGVPQHALITLVLPRELEVSWVERLYAGLRRCAETYGVSIVGGETAGGPLVMVSVSLTGKVREGRVLRRDGARAGDVIAVTGQLGGSITGHHLSFEPRVAEAGWLVESQQVQAMMDLSDGLAKDLPRMAKASGVEFVLEEGTLPVNPGCSAARLGDGEDYELLLAIPAAAWEALAASWAARFPEVPLTRIGTFVPMGLGEKPDFVETGWEHFVTAPPVQELESERSHRRIQADD